jgi:hypothetical protein
MDERMLAGVILLVIGWIVKGWVENYRSGRVEKKAIYVSSADCQAIRDKCCVTQIKKDLAAEHSDLESFQRETKIRLRAVEKRLDQGREDFQAIRRDIGEINKTLASMAAILEQRAKVAG